MAGQELVTALRQNPYFGLDGIPIEDFKAYPVVFLYRHALELYIKAVILAGLPKLAISENKGVADYHKGLLTTHSLDTISKLLERVFDAYGWTWDFETPKFRSLDDFRSTIAEIHGVDSGSYVFRYPLNTKGCASIPSRFRFDLFEFCAVLDELLRSLEGTAVAAYEEGRL